MSQSQHIARLFLESAAANRDHDDARECADRFIAGLARSGLWEAEELDELRQLIEDGLTPGR